MADTRRSAANSGSTIGLSCAEEMTVANCFGVRRLGDPALHRPDVAL